MSLVGPDTLRGLEGLHADKMFMTVEAINIRRSVTISRDSFESELVKRMIAACTCIILLVVGSRVGRGEGYQILPLSGSHILVTDQSCPDYYVSQLREQGIEVIKVYTGSRKISCP